MRTIIDLPEEQIQALLILGKQEKKSRAMLIREAVAKLVSEKMAQKNAYQQVRREAISAAFGIWKDREIDGVEYQRSLRREWDEREKKLWASHGEI